jgi:hypothetical protein
MSRAHLEYNMPPESSFIQEMIHHVPLSAVRAHIYAKTDTVNPELMT